MMGCHFGEIPVFERIGGKVVTWVGEPIAGIGYDQVLKRFVSDHNQCRLLEGIVGV